MASVDEVKAFVKSQLKDKLVKAGVPDPRDDFSLLEAKILDSFALLDLVAAAEQKFSVTVVMGAHNLDQFATVGGFASAVAASESIS